jgi:AhpD family alkylhydroperoxidase
MEVEMENDQPTIEQLLKNMEKISGGDPRPMRVLAQINPAFVFEQARGRKMVMELPHIPAKYKHLIMIAVAAAGESEMCTTTFMKAAKIAGVTKEEIAEAVMTARQAKAATIFAASVDGFEEILKDG